MMISLNKISVVSLAFALACSSNAWAQDSVDAEASIAPAQSEQALDDGLLSQSLEELLSQEVTSASKKSRPVAETAGAVVVISQEQIRRSSARTVPDLLRMVPGMEVVEVQSSATSVSARGFSSRFSASLLVMIDGAAIYNTSISGMFWDQALIPLQDIERIEVIRGPGGTVWGSNATNGVINIITKQGIDTQGLRANVSYGSYDTRAEIGYGAQLGEDLGYRVYADYRRTNGLDGVSGKREGDSWEGGLAGFRMDYAPNETDNYVALAEASEGAYGEREKYAIFDPFNPHLAIRLQDNKFHSRHLLARWKHASGDNFDFGLQAYFNNLLRTEFDGEINRDMYDASFESRLKANEQHEFNFGIGGRISVDRVKSSPSLSYQKERNVDRWLTGFLQDEVTLIPNKLRLTLGSKFEVNNFTGTELQPGVRLFYRHNDNLSLWASIARGVRTPLLLQRDMVAISDNEAHMPGIPEGFPIRRIFNGNKDARAEEVMSIEWGARAALGKGWSFDLAAFRSEYSSLVTARVTAQGPLMGDAPFLWPVGVGVNTVITNEGSARSQGAELMLSGPLSPQWNLELSYSFLDLDTASASNTAMVAGDGPTPKHQIRAASRLELTDNLQFDVFGHFVSRSKDKTRPEYLDADVRLNWRFNPRFDISLVGNNLLKKRRVEYVQDWLPLEVVAVQRSAYIQANLRF